MTMTEDEERAQLIREILEVRAEQEQLQSKMSTITEQKAELQQISDSLKSAITDKANRELEVLDNERIYMSKKAVHDEETIKKSFEAKLAQVLKQKDELERRLEAESEFITRNLVERLSKLHARTLELRSQLGEKVKEVSQKLNGLAPDEVVRCHIESYQDQCMELARKIAEGHREIEGLTAKGTRLNAILDKLTQQAREKDGGIVRYEHTRIRRSSNAALRRPRRPLP